ncbi:hypothetical protein BJD12_04175 [Xanthomonas vesicatoria ATCC 35937]|uniref:Uncharacterized protein n=1 Tax=Xanthomonas vesicatoria ATCC 35937 TaxID=925775 RepID=F0BI63_9XANT|nr:hypothetical protein BJD12_04175 [Xanthomonas vesicatoria ATCC 35937]EGD07828.1 hypothetical protein XVE_3963 [Xanthomonas vesicatoria ATCC 35937]KTF30051.1 hypothetical protein LMG920_20615 [Xanthomonas vesicatoria]KTF37468.1 hypothetical protein LMG919_07155 [Xanthomonas vesicatoria]
MNMMFGGTRLAVVNGSVGNVIPAFAGSDSSVASMENMGTRIALRIASRRRRNELFGMFMVSLTA